VKVRIAFWASRHARFILFVVAALVVGGIFGALTLPVSLFPRVNFPRVRIDLEAGERPAERMVLEITRPVEEELRSIPGVRGVQSVSSRGSAQVLLTFDWGDDITADMLQAEARVNKLLPSLPPGTNFGVRRMDPTFFPVISYSLTSDARSLSELHDLAEYQLRPILSTVAGVAKVSVTGGAVDEYRVTVDPARLRAHNLAISDVSTALSAANVLTAVGRLEDREKLYLVVTDTRLKSAQEIAATVLRSGTGGVVRLSDVAQVRKQPATRFTRSTADGHDAVLFDVFQQPGSNTVQIAEQIRQALANEQKRLPPDVKVSNWYDQSELIVASATSVRDAVLIGVALAALVLLLFLRDWRITLIAALAVPIVLAVTALLLYVLGQSFNIMTLGGMAAAVGLIIDDAIVMSEHIVRRLHARSESGATDDARTRVLDASDEFTKPLTGSSLSTIVIHIPPAFMIGVIGAFFAALSLSMASSLVISFFITWLAIPVVASRWLRSRKSAPAQPHPTPARNRVHETYSRLMHWVLPRPWVVLPLVLGMLVLGWLIYRHLPNDFMPAVDEGGFTIDYRADPGTSVSETDRLCRKVEQILRNTPDVQTYSRRTGYNFGSGELSESNTGDFFVRLKPMPRRPIKEVQDEIEKKIAHDVPGLDIETAQLMEDLIGDLTGRPQPVVVNLYSDDQAALQELAEKVKTELGKIADVKEVRSGIIPAGDALDVEVDRVKASLEGVDPESLTKSLTDLVTGSVTTQVQQGPKLVDVRVWIPKGVRNTTRDIGELLLRAPDGHVFPLKRVAKLSMITGQPEITREDLKRMVSVTARSDRDLGSTIKDVRAMLDQRDFLPPGIRYTLGGQYEQQQIAFRGLLKVIAAAGALVFALLLFLFESFRVAIAIMLTTLLSMTLVFLGLWATGTHLNISSLMGMVMIVGNVTEVAIFYYAEYEDLRRQPRPATPVTAPDNSSQIPFARVYGPMDENLISAGSYRMRAITMTTVAAILALLPLALAIGQGSGMLQPLAIAIIAGLVAQLPMVLFVLPALLSLTRRRREARP
jgi:CzcA family heavy metal efflux pump